MFLQNCWWKCKKKCSTRYFFQLSIKNIAHGCFHNHATFCEWFWGENKERKQQNYQKLWHITYFNIINMSVLLTLLMSVFLRFPPLTKFKYAISCCCFFSNNCLIHGQLVMPLRYVKRPMFLSLGYSATVSFILGTTFSVTEIPPQKDSAMY